MTNNFANTVSDRSIYQAPESSMTVEGLLEQVKPKMGAVIWCLAIIQIISGVMCIGLSLWIFNNASMISLEGVDIFGYVHWIGGFLLCIGLYQSVAYFGLLCRQNWARVMVLVNAHLVLAAFPFGTIQGIIFIHCLKGKRF